MSEDKTTNFEESVSSTPQLLDENKTKRQAPIPNLRWTAATFILGGIVSVFLCLGDNWGAPETYIVLGGNLLIAIGSAIAIFYERNKKPLFGVLHQAYFIYGVLLLLGSGLTGVALSLGNVLVPLVIPFYQVPFAFYILLVTTIVISVEFGISIVKNFRK